MKRIFIISIILLCMASTAMASMIVDIHTSCNVNDSTIISSGIDDFYGWNIDISDSTINLDLSDYIQYNIDSYITFTLEDPITSVDFITSDVWYCNLTELIWDSNSITLNLDGLYLLGYFINIDYTTDDGGGPIGGGTPVPINPSALLLGGGLFILVVIRRNNNS